jgi:hypothetical protein
LYDRNGSAPGQCAVLRSSASFGESRVDVSRIQSGGADPLWNPQASVKGIASSSTECRIRPAVVLTLRQPHITDETIGDTLSRFQAIDDVYSPAFDDVLVLQTWGAAVDSGSSWQSFKSSLFNDTKYLEHKSADDLLPEGPYFLNSHSIHQAWRLYDDTLDAFIVSVVPEDAKSPEK